MECLTLDRDSFIQLIGELSEIKEKKYGDEERGLTRPVSSSNFAADFSGNWGIIKNVEI